MIENPLGATLSQRIERKLREPAFQRDPDFISAFLPLLAAFSRYFDGEVRGWERLPARGPMLLVGNHSGGLLVPDAAVFLHGWFRERGVEEPFFSLAFDAMFGVPGMETLMRKLGEVPASHDNAAALLQRGAALLVYPGGAHEAFRPWLDRNRIDFGGHMGFVKLALRTGVPVVPVVAHGGHETTVVLTRGDGVARWLGSERLRLHVAPLVLQLPWGISSPIFPGLPLPAKITIELGGPIDWSSLGAAAADDPATVRRCYRELTRKMQRRLTALAAERPFPVLSRLRRLLPL